MMKAIEEFAAECSMIKVYGSEVLDYVVDEGVQIHGGDGFHQDYAVEGAHRASRTHRIFVCTHKIKRLPGSRVMLKRRRKRTLPPVLAACSEGDSLRANIAVLRRFTKYDPVDAIALRRQIAGRLLDAERYVV